MIVVVVPHYLITLGLMESNVDMCFQSVMFTLSYYALMASTTKACSPKNMAMRGRMRWLCQDGIRLRGTFKYTGCEFVSNVRVG